MLTQPPGRPGGSGGGVCARLEWRLQTRGRVWTGGLLACMAWWELTLGSLLAPVSMPVVLMSLYNQMHFGRSGVLAAKVMATMALPWLALLLVAALIRRIGRAPGGQADGV